MELTIKDLQNQLDDIKQRLGAVEHKAENRAAVGPRGPQGPPGFKGDKGDKGDSIVGNPGRDGRDGRNGETPCRATVEATLIQLLQDYHILDSECRPCFGPYAAK
jgi:hypothetical protein